MGDVTALRHTGDVTRRLVSSTFVGRRAELEELGGAVADASTGRASVQLIAGDAGVGKTRLVEEFASRSRASGALVAVGGCVDLGEVGVPYMAVVDLLRDLITQLGPAGWANLAGRVPAELAPLLPAEVDSTEAPSAMSPGSARGRLFELFLGLLVRMGQGGPLAAVLEDLQWADASTRDLIAFLARNLRRGRVVVVGTYRLDDLHRRHPLRPLLAELSRAGVPQVRLQSFDRAELTDQLTSILGSTPDRRLVDEILARSEGNPFYAEELIAAAQTGQRGLPSTLHDVLSTRLEALGDSTQGVLQAIAAVGRQAPHTLLARITGLADDELEDALARALGAQVLVSVPPDRYSFRHALLKEAAEEDMVAGRRRRLHRQIAETLTNHPELAGTDRGGLQARLAHHWEQAGNHARCLEASIEAGRAAGAMAAPAEARVHYERALSLWEQVDDPAALAGVDHVGLTMAAADAAYLTGDARGAVALARCVLDEADMLHDPARPALLRARLGQFTWEAGDHDRAFSLYERAVGLLAGEPPSSARARVLAAYGRALMVTGRPSEAVGVCEEAIALARDAGDRAVEGHACNTLGVVLQFGKRWEDGLEHLRCSLTIAEELGDPEDLLRAYNNLAASLAWADEREEAADILLAGVEKAKTLGCLSGIGSIVLTEAAEVLVRLGRLSQAATLLEESELPEHEGMSRIHSLLARAALALAVGDIPAAEVAVADALAELPPGTHAEQSWPVLSRAAEVAIAAGRCDEARGLIDDIRGRLAGSDDHERAVEVATLGVKVEAEAVRRGGPAGASAERARALLSEARRAELAADRSAGRGLDARLAVAEAEASDAAGGPDPTLWAPAVEKLECLGLTLEAAQARLSHAEAVLTALGARGQAAGIVAQAREVAAAAGAQGIVAAADRLATRARLDIGAAAPPHTPDATQRFGLTPRELEVLSQLAAGRTNRQIATALFISDKTVSVHVSNLIRKLAVRNRIEAGAIGQRLT